MKKIFLLMLLVLTVGGASLFFYVRNMDFSTWKSRIVAEISQNINAEVTIQDIVIRGFSTLSVEGLRISTGNRQVAEVDSLYLNLHLPDLLQKKMTLTSAGISGARVNLFFIDGKLNLSTLSKAGAAQAPAALPRLTMVAADPSAPRLSVDSIKLQDILLLYEDRNLATIQALGKLDYPSLNLSEVALSLYKGKSVVKVAVDADLTSQSALVRVLQGEIRASELAPFAPQTVIPPLSATVSGQVQVRAGQVTPDLNIVTEALAWSNSGHELNIAPMQIRVNDKISLVADVNVSSIKARVELFLTDFLAGIDSLRLTNSRLTVSSDLSALTAVSSGQVDLDVNLDGTLGSLDTKGVYSSKGIQVQKQSEPLRLAGTFDGRIDALKQRAAFKEVILQLEAFGKRSQMKGTLGYDGTRPYPQSLMVDVKGPEVPLSMFHPDLESFYLRDIHLRSGLSLGFMFQGQSTRLSAQVQVDPLQAAVPKDLQITGQVDISDLHTLFKKLDIPLVRARFDIQTLMQKENVVLALSSKEVLIPLTPTLAPMRITDLTSALTVNIVNHSLSLTKVRGTVFSGAFEFSGKGNVMLLDHPHEFNGKLVGLDIKSLAAYGSEAMRDHFSGTIDAQFSKIHLLKPEPVGPPVLIEGNVTIRQPVYYYHRSVADALDGVQAQIRQKFLANLLKEQAAAQQENVRYSAFMDVEAVPFRIERNQIVAGPLTLQENRGDFRVLTQSVKITMPPTDTVEGQVQTDISCTLSNQFVRSKFPYMRDNHIEDFPFTIQVNGPFSQPVSMAEQTRLKSTAGEMIGRTLDLGKAQAAVTQQVQRIKNLFSSDSTSAVKEEASKQVESQIEDKIRQSLRGVERTIGTTETQKIQEKIQNKVTEQLFKLFK